MNNPMPLKRFFGLAEFLVVTLAFILFVSLTFDRGDAYYDCTQETTPKLCCNGVYYYNTSYACGGHGNCIVTSTPPYCQCNNVREGDNCELEKQCGSSSCGIFCSSHGTCDTGSNACLCNPGYGGECCSSPISINPVLKPAAVAFGPVTVGSAAQTQTVTLATPVKIVIGSISLGGGNASDFSLGGTCTEGASLASGGSCTITAAFTPTAAGSRGATLTVKTGPPDRYAAVIGSISDDGITGPTVTTLYGPTVTTAPATDITETSATANAAITGLGTSAGTEHGVCWGEDRLPEVAKYYIPGNCVALGAAATGSFTAAITGLSADTTYLLRPYAMNAYYGANGKSYYPISYGSSVTLHTASASAAGSSPVTATTLTAAMTGTGTISAESIVIDPATPTTLYAGLNGAGVYRSVNSGATWAATAGQPGNRSIKALVIDKSDPRVLYAGAYGGGVYRTVDGGASWGACAALGNMNVVSLTIDANGKLYAGTEAGVFLSADGCATWAAMSTGLP
jgi:hypothetical protein